MSSQKSKFIISIFLPDRVGIIADVTETVFRLGGDIGSIQQTLIDGYFSLTFTAAFSSDISGPAPLEESLRALLGGDAAVTIREIRADASPAIPDGERFIAVTHGSDRPGLIYAISSFFVENGVNIENWQMDALDGEVVYVAEVVMPAGADTVAIQKAFADRLALHGIAATLAHENIFRATNEIGHIASLLPAGRMRVVK